MSGTLVYPLPGRAADNLKPWWNNGPVTAIQLDSPTPVGFVGAKQTFTGFATGGYLNPRAATITGTLSGINTTLANVVQNFGMDLAGNFSFDMIATVNQDVMQIQQGGVNSNNTNPVKVLSNWTPTNPIATNVNCLFQFDSQDPDCIGLAGPGTVPPIAVIYNKINRRQFMTVNCRNPDQVKWARGGGLGVTRSMQFAPLNNVIGTWDGAVTPWIIAFDSVADGSLNGGNTGKLGIHGMDNIIRAFNGGSLIGIPAMTVVQAFNQTIAAQTYGNVNIWCGVPNNSNSQWIQTRWNQPSGQAFDTNGRDITNVGGFASGTGALGNGNYYCAAVYNGNGTVTFRVNGTATQTNIAITPGGVPIFMSALVIGGNNIVPGAGGNLPNGCPFNKMGSMQIWQGALTGTDLTNAETWVSASIQ